MALIIYPAENYDSLISVADATLFISKYSVHSSLWTALSVEQQEIYLRIATERIFNVISTNSEDDLYLDVLTYGQTSSCLPKAACTMAMHDIVHSISSSINPNTGLITKEKIGDLEINYSHSYAKLGIERNPFPVSVRSCLALYGAEFAIMGLFKATVEKA